MKKVIKAFLVVLLVCAMALPTSCMDIDSTTQGPSGSSGNFQEGITIDETVVYDQGGIKIAVTGYQEGWTGPEIKLQIENNTSDNVLVTAELLSVNGYMQPLAGLYATVAAGKKANEKIALYTSELKQAGIDTIAEVQLYFDISNTDTYDDIAKSDLVSIKTSQYGFAQKVDDSGELLYDKNGIKVVCKGKKQDAIWDASLVFYIENNSGKEVSVYAENVSINGYMVTASLWSSLRNETKIVDGLSVINLDEVQIENIEDIKQIEFNLRIVDGQSWELVDTTDPMTLNFD